MENKKMTVIVSKHKIFEKTYISCSLCSSYIEPWEIYQLGNIIRDVLQIVIFQWITVICN